MKILIIGAKGMLGQELAKTFADNDLSLWDKEDLDITKKQQVREKIVSLRPAVIINAAAYNAVDDIEDAKNFDLAMKINADGPKNLAFAAQEIDAILVHYSSDYVFDGSGEQGYSEDEKPNPVNKYGESKLAGEKNVLENCDKSYVIRLSRLFGRPAVTEGAKKSFVDVMRDLAKDRDEFNLVDEEVSCPTYAPDLARRTREIIDGRYNFGIYHVTNEGACTWFGFGEEIFKIIGKSPKLNRVGSNAYPRPAKRPHFAELKNNKLPPMRSWQEALRDYLDAN